MGHKEAHDAVQKIPNMSSERLLGEAIVHSLEALDVTIRRADGTISNLGHFVNLNLSRLKESADETNRAMGAFRGELNNLSGNVDALNYSFQKFEKSTDKLGRTANWLTIGLLFFAGVQAAAAILSLFKNSAPPGI